MEFLQKVGYTHTKQTKPEKAADLLVAEQPITEITSEKQFDDVLNSVGDKLVVADFYATYCVPCQNMMPILKKLAAAFTTQAVFVKINVSENGPIAEKFELDSVPVFLFFKNGKIVQKFVGAKSYEFFEDQIKHLTANSLRA
jgi:thioredoxin 1